MFILPRTMRGSLHGAQHRGGERVGPSRGIYDFDIVVAEQRVDAQLLGNIILDDQKPPAPRLRASPALRML